MTEGRVSQEHSDADVHLYKTNTIYIYEIRWLSSAQTLDSGSSEEMTSSQPSTTLGWTVVESFEIKLVRLQSRELLIK